jgi:hypothetical protein
MSDFVGQWRLRPTMFQPSPEVPKVPEVPKKKKQQQQKQI